MSQSPGRAHRLVFLAAVVILVLVLLAAGFGVPAISRTPEIEITTVGSRGSPECPSTAQTHRSPATTPRSPPSS